MFTRFKVAIGFTLFSFTFIFLLIFLGPSGLRERSDISRQALLLKDESEKKVAEVELLRETAQNSTALEGEVELLYSFSDSPISITESKKSFEESKIGIHYLSYLECFIISVAVELLYLTLLLLIHIIKKRVRRGFKKGGYDGYIG